MMYRTTKLISQHNEFMNRSLYYIFQLCQQTSQDYFMFEDQKISIKGKSLEQIQKENKYENRPGQVLVQLQVAMRLIELRLQNDGIMVSKLLDDENEFVTSDNPVCFTNMSPNQLSAFNPENVLSLPLDSKHKLFLMPYADKDSFNLLMRRSSIGQMGYCEKLTSNYSQTQNSERFIYGTKSSLESYLRTKEATEKPITEDEFKNSEIGKELIKTRDLYREIINALKKQDDENLN